MTRNSKPITYFDSTAGSFVINGGGGASYSFAAPPSMAKLKPHLSLVYRTGGGNIDQLLWSFRRSYGAYL